MGGDPNCAMLFMIHSQLHMPRYRYCSTFITNTVNERFIKLLLLNGIISPELKLDSLDQFNIKDLNTRYIHSI